MRSPIFLGDELSAVGFRLAGARVATPPMGEEISLLQWARGEAEVVFLTAELAARLPEPTLHHALTARRPLVLVIADVQQRVAPRDLGIELRRKLGLAE